MRIVLTGGAGFIGSCLLRTLNDAGERDILIVDHIGSTEKWRNLENKQFDAYVHKDTFLNMLPDMGRADVVIHLGACSSTTEKDFDYLARNNVDYTKALWNYCAEKDVPLIYASSAATYGNISGGGYSDETDIQCLRPLNGYGYSKQMFDLWSERQENRPPQYVGLKFFNVYGPNEYHKGEMSSVVLHAFQELNRGEAVHLFRSCHPDYQDGGQLRDFVYVKDVCSVILFFLRNPGLSGLYNVGTGRAQSFYELASAVCEAMGIATKIEYIDMPEHLRAKYQYHTRAEIQKLRDAGYDGEFLALREGVRDYVQNYLMKDLSVY